MRRSGVYKIRNKLTDIGYIGSSVDLDSRWYLHRKHLRKGIHNNDYLQKAWNKHGEENFEFLILEYCDNTICRDREGYYQDLEKSYERDKGYNLRREDGHGGVMHEETKKKIGASNKGKTKGMIKPWSHAPISEETLARLRETLKKKKESGWRRTCSPETKLKLSKSCKGRIVSEETKEKRSKALKGKLKSEDHKRKIAESLKQSEKSSKGFAWIRNIKTKECIFCDRKIAEEKVCNELGWKFGRFMKPRRKGVK